MAYYKTFDEWLLEKKETESPLQPPDYEQHLSVSQKAQAELAKKAAKDGKYVSTLKHLEGHLKKLEGPGGKDYYADYTKKVK